MDIVFARRVFAVLVVELHSCFILNEQVIF